MKNQKVKLSFQLINKMAVAFILIFVAQVSQANPPDHFFEVQSLNCHLKSGRKLQLDRSTSKVVLIQKNKVVKQFYWDGAVQFLRDQKYELRFTGHKPSAGPVLDIWESDYVIESNSFWPDSGEVKLQGPVLKKSLWGLTSQIDQAECHVQLRKIF